MVFRFILKSSVNGSSDVMHDAFGFLADGMCHPVFPEFLSFFEFLFQHPQPVGRDCGKQSVRFASGQFFPFLILTRKRVREKRFFRNGDFEHLPLSLCCRCIR